jgi:hypothetical protein
LKLDELKRDSSGDIPFPRLEAIPCPPSGVEINPIASTKALIRLPSIGEQQQIQSWIQSLNETSPKMIFSWDLSSQAVEA